MRNLIFICILGFNSSVIAVSPDNIPFSLDNKALENTTDYTEASTEQLLFSSNSKTVKFIEQKGSHDTVKKTETVTANPPDPDLINIIENSETKSESDVNTVANNDIKNTDTVKIEHGALDHPPKTDTLVKIDENLQIISDHEIKKLKDTVLTKSVDGTYKNTDDVKNSDITLQSLKAEKRRLEQERQKIIQLNSSSSTVLTKKDFLFK